VGGTHPRRPFFHLSRPCHLCSFYVELLRSARPPTHLHAPYFYAPRIPADLLIRSGYTCSSTNLSRRNIVVPTRCRSLGPKGTPGTPPPPQENPQGPLHLPTPHPQGRAEGAQGPRGPLGKMGPWGPLGLFRSHSEWSVIPKPVRRPFRTDGPSEWKVIPCVHTVAKMPNRFKWN